MIIRVRVLAATFAVCLAAPAYADPPPASPPPPAQTPAPAPAPGSHIRDKAEDIVTQPARDVGITKVKIPAVLAKASEDPYSLEGLKSCRQIAGVVQELNLALGPDFKAGDKYQENRAAKLAEAGGTSVINGLIPFRSLVREATGAAPADRRLRAAVNAGFAQRGFLRGVYLNRKCKPRF